MKRNRTRIIAILGVAGVAAAGAVGFAVTGGDERPVAGYCAQMPDAIGLYEGNPVTRMGVRIGTVDHIAPKGEYVEVGFTLDSGHGIPASAQAITRSKSILADRSLELVGSPGAGPELTAGACIPLTAAHTPKSISEITGSAADFIDRLAPDNGQESFRTAVAGLADALRGQGPNARAMMLHAAAAAGSPDQLIADLGTIIADTAPLTDDALRNWQSVRSILDQMPAVVAAGIDLFPGVIDVCVGVGWLVNILHDVHTGYGDLLWPLLRGPVADAVHLAAGRSGDLRGLVESIPAVAALLRRQTGEDGAMLVAYQPPPGGPLDLLFGGGVR